MPTVELGFFVVVLSFALLLTFLAFVSRDNIKGILHIVGMTLFLVLGVWTSSGYEVSATTTELIYNETGGQIFNVTKSEAFISGGQETSWFSYVFLGMAFLNLALFVKDVWTGS